MGRIQIRDRTDEWEITTASWDGVVELQLDDGDDLEVVVSDQSPYTADDIVITERRMGGPSSLLGDGPMWLLYAPTVLGLLTLFVDELDVLAPVPSSIAWALQVGLYWTFFLFGVVGTMYLYNDAQALATTDRAWQPNPWAYVLGGGVGVTAVKLLVSGFPSGTWQSTVAALAGLLVVGCAVAAAVAGPVYLLARRRFLDAPATD